MGREWVMAMAEYWKRCDSLQKEVEVLQQNPLTIQPHHGSVGHYQLSIQFLVCGKFPHW